MTAQSFSNSEIDRLGDRLRAGETDEDLRMLDAYRFSFVGAYGQVIETSKSLSRAEITGRPAKSTTAIIEKLRRESIRLSQMQDIAGCRVLVTDIKAQNTLVAQLAAAFNDAVVVNRREKPSHGYRAVHLVVTIGQRVVEIQLRTSLQQFWALLSEKVADKFGNAIKYGGGDQQALHQLESLSVGIAQVEQLRNATDWDSATMTVTDKHEAHIRQMVVHLLISLGVEHDLSD
jgi:ppGpp synthetase/RelA/SpoT-type nucleotidyltranferase